ETVSSLTPSAGCAATALRSNLRSTRIKRCSTSFTGSYGDAEFSAAIGGIVTLLVMMGAMSEFLADTGFAVLERVPSIAHRATETSVASQATDPRAANRGPILRRHRWWDRPRTCPDGYGSLATEIELTWRNCRSALR